MNSHRLGGVFLTGLSYTPYVFTEPGLQHPVSAAYVLGPTQLYTLSSILDTGNAVDDSRGGTGG